MPTLLQQLAMSFDAENTTAESLEIAEQQRETIRDNVPSMRLQQRERENLQLDQQIENDSLKMQYQQREHDPLQFQQRREQLQMQQRAEREHQQHNEKIQMHQREHIAQLQSINNLLHDLPPTPKGSYLSARGHESPYGQSLKGSESDMSISDLFGLNLPRGSLMGSQSSIGSSSYRPQQQPHNVQNSGHSPPRSTYPFDEGHNYYPSSPSMDMPGTPNSATTPASPSTPGSAYSNPYSYPASGNSSGYATPSSSNRSHYGHGSPSSPGHSLCYGRPIRGSPAYSDCGSPTLEYPHLLGFGGSRSNSPADSETSGYCSVDGSLSDIMVRNCLSMNSSGHSCYPPSMSGLLTPGLDLYHGGNRETAYQRMAVKKYQQQHHSNMRHHHCCSPANHLLPMNKPANPPASYKSLDRAAKDHRNAAALRVATCIWSGDLPKRNPKATSYSSKVFLGGVPWDVPESLLVSTFKQFGLIRVEWPGKEQSDDQQHKGYAYIILESEKQVKSLLACCTVKIGEEKSWYYRIVPKRSKPKDIQVIPWYVNDSNYSKSSTQKLDPEKTVFVGALHGVLTAEGLARVMNDLFDEVIYAGIDTDKWKYPIGSARVTFSSKSAYKKACAAAFVEIRTEKFTKTVQVDPYIEDSVCSSCGVQHGPYFCREPICSRYFCRSCWLWQHASKPMHHHFPMSRRSKTNQFVSLGPNSGPNGNR